MAEQMKPSGIDWIGDIPKSWKVTRLQTLFDQVKDKNSGTKEKKLLSLSYGKIVKKDIEGAFGLIPESFDTYNIIKKNDIVLRLTDMQNDQVSLRTGLVKEEKGIITSAYVTIRLKCGSPSYYHWYLYAFDTSKQIYAFGQGVRQSLTFEELKKMLILLPSPKEQQAIADFLDEECAQIDSIATDLEKQIALLQQYKKSLITEIVTKGLDKSVPMKDSGVEWLGKIPVHWNFKRLKFMLENSSDSMKVGPFGSALSGSDFTDEGKWVYNQRVVLDNNFSENTTFVSEEKFQEMRSFAVYPGDILITTRGTIGKVAIVPEGANEGILHPCIIKFRVDKEMIIPELLQLIFNESDFVKDQFTLMSNATTIEVIYSYSLKDILLPVIPADEQEKIYGYLSKKCIAIDGIISEKQKALATIIQHKKSLIYEYVTGKKRVKEVR